MLTAQQHSLILTITQSHLKKKKKRSVLGSACWFWSSTSQKVSRSWSKKMFGLFLLSLSYTHKKCTQMKETTRLDGRMALLFNKHSSLSRWPHRQLPSYLLIPSQCTYHRWRCHSSAQRMTLLTGICWLHMGFSMHLADCLFLYLQTTSHSAQIWVTAHSFHAGGAGICQVWWHATPPHYCSPSQLPATLPLDSIPVRRSERWSRAVAAGVPLSGPRTGQCYPDLRSKAWSHH